MATDDRLDMPAEEIRAIGLAATRLIASYYESLPERAVIEASTAAAIREAIREPLPQEGVDFDTLLATVRDVILRFSRHNGHPRCFGYVSSPAAPVAAVGSMVEAALNANVTCWRSAPAGTELERLAIDWLKEMLGYPAGAAGLLVSGGSMANFAALAAARSAGIPAVVRKGVGAAGKRLCVYVSEEGHYSIRKAAGMLGMGEENVRTVKTGEGLRMNVADLERLVCADLAAGHLPLCVVANLGTTASGAVDPLAEVAEVARRLGLWLHVDAAYGGFAALAPSGRRFFEHIGEADSVTLDPHKWLYLPVGCGCVLFRDPATARAAFSQDAEYTRVIGLERDEAFAFWDYGPELSRPFRALDLWLLLKYAGARRLGQAIERNMACAKRFEKLVCGSADFEMLAPVELSVFCFRHAPPGFAGDLDALNERILVNLQRGGGSYLSNARIGGKFALRGCVLNYRTTERDMEILLDDVRRASIAAA
jgi:glutamate/tyrosine decarboxylase-like PLP-dependent enzyme